MPETFTLDIRVYYEDTDSGGVVYHSNYLNFMERARTEWLRDLGFEQDQLIEELQTIFAVRSAKVEYLSPAKFNDCLQIHTTIKDKGRCYLNFYQQIFRQQNNKNTELLAEAEIKVVSINTVNFKPKKIPIPIMEQLNGQ